MVFWRVLEFALLLYFLLLFVRAALGWLQLIKPDWRPHGPMLIVAEITYSATDPPLRWVGRLVRPVRIGPVAIDVSFLVVVFVCWVLLQIVGFLGR